MAEKKKGIIEFSGDFLTHVESGLEGLRLLEKEKIQVIMSDVDLPDMDFTDFETMLK